MTRLRLYLKDDNLPKDDEVKKISGVLGVVRGGQQYQIGDRHQCSESV